MQKFIDYKARRNHCDNLVHLITWQLHAWIEGIRKYKPTVKTLNWNSGYLDSNLVSATDFLTLAKPLRLGI